jgi:hypothetical protein
VVRVREDVSVKVQRYSCDISTLEDREPYPEHYRDDDGDWVRYEDIRGLIQEGYTQHGQLVCPRCAYFFFPKESKG